MKYQVMLSNLCKVFATLIIFTPHIFLCNLKSQFLAKVSRNRLVFHISRYYNKLRFGQFFEFHPVTQPSTTVQITKNQNGNITSIQDGKRTPLVLSSIPSQLKHIQQLKTTYKSNNYAFGIYTLNEPWECYSAGLTQLLRQDLSLQQFQYPTTDMTAPKQIDLLRAVYDLEHRDQYNHSASVVHCKAGRGRSATVVAAYLMHIAYQNNYNISIEQVIAYLKKCRPQVALGSIQKQAIQVFAKKLHETQGLENLYHLNKAKVIKREEEIQEVFREKIKFN